MNPFSSAIVFLIVFVAVQVAGAGADETLERARAARESGLPQVVIHDLKVALEQELEGERKLALGVELARCLVASDRASEALVVLEQPGFQDDVEARYWNAMALSSAGASDAALQIFSAIAELPDGEYVDDARVGKARMLEALGDPAAARREIERVALSASASNAVRLDLVRLLIASGDYAEAMRTLDALEGLTDSERELATYLDARVSLDLGNAVRANDLFSGLGDSQQPMIRSSAMLGEVDALMSLNRLVEAEERLEGFMDASPVDPQIALLFEKLDELYIALPDAGSAELRRWARDEGNPLFASYAAFYLGRHELRAGRNAQALAAFTRFGEQRAGHPLRADAIIHAVEMYYAAGQITEAFEVLSLAGELSPADPAMPKMQFLRAMLNLAAGREVVARSLFLNVSTRFEDLSRAAAENASLAQALAGDKWDPSDTGEAAVADLPISEDAALRKALIGARDLRSGDELLALSNTALNASVRARAAFAAAELALERGEPDDAQQYFQRVVNQPGVTDVQTGALEIFLADDGTSEAAVDVIGLARAYLKQFEDAPRAAEVRMKLGECLARRGDYRQAWVEFELAGRNSGDRIVSSSALYFAADSAAKTMDPEAIERSIELYEEVARSGGPLAFRARLDQATLYSLLERRDEALVLLDRLAAEADGKEIRLAAKMKQADTLFVMGNDDPARMKEAIALWGEISLGDVPVPDRNEAFTKAAMAHEQLGDTDAALSGYYRVVDTAGAGEPDYFWYYKAGFDAARLLESQDRWQEAMIVYKKLADSGGPRSAEAESRVKRLRLENFIWE